MSSNHSSEDEKELVKVRRRGGGRRKKRKISNEAALKKSAKKRNVKKKDFSSDSDSDDECDQPLSAAASSSKKKSTASASSDEDDVPLRDFAKSGKKGDPKKQSSVTGMSGQAKENGKATTTAQDKGSSDEGDDAVESDGTTGFEVQADDNDDRKSLASSSKSGNGSSNEEKAAKKLQIDENDDEAAKETATVAKTSRSAEATKTPTAAEDDSSSDTSVYDSDPGSKKAKKDAGDGLKEKSEKKTKSKLEKGSRKKPKTGGKEDENPRLTRLKRCAREAGLRCIYKQLFADCQSDKERINKLEQYFRDKGFTGAISLESAKAFRLKREEQKEMAELDTKNIISGGRTRRHDFHTLFPHDDVVDEPKKQESDSEKTDSSDEEAASEARRERKELFSRLKGIVDSDESD